MPAHRTGEIHHAGPDLFENKELVRIFCGAFLEECFPRFPFFLLHLVKRVIRLFDGGGDMKPLIIQNDGGSLLFCELVFENRTRSAEHFFCVAGGNSSDLHC